MESDLVNLPPGFSINNDINDPDCGLPIDTIAENVFVNCFEFRVGEQPSIELTLQIPEPKEIWPTIPTSGASTRFDFDLVQNVKEGISVKLESNEISLENQQIDIYSNWIIDSGGHNHDASNDLPTPPPTSMGTIFNSSTNHSANVALSALTNTEGIINLRFQAPEFGGKVELKARYIIDGDTLLSRDTLNITVPDLVLLPEGIAYSKVGGTPSHNGPRVDQLFLNFREPDNNHYGIQEMVDFIVDLSNLWEATVLADSLQDNRQTPLNINDMSLPNGGDFDINGSWTGSHAYHRVGRDVDIRTTRNLPIGNNRNGVLLTSIQDSEGNNFTDSAGNPIFRNRLFERLISRLEVNVASGIHGTGNNEHYHIYFY